MQSKSLLIAIAAFAVTTSGVHAYNGAGTKLLNKAGLNKEQVQALAEAHEFKLAGDLTSARDILVDAGITDDTLQKVHRAKNNKTKTVWAELNLEQKEALLIAKQSNDRATVRAILEEAGLEYHPKSG